jgi:outer membrane protein OmpA-like peptidoglycan-associated protein
MKQSLVVSLSILSSLALSACSTAIVKNPESRDASVAQSSSAEEPIHAAAAAPAQMSADDQARAAIDALKSGLRFKPYSAKLAPRAAQTLSQAATALQASNASIEIDGYADSSGSNSLNDRLANERAATVRSFLIKHGVASNRISAKGHGENDPAYSNDSAEGRAGNRRVEIKLN